MPEEKLKVVVVGDGAVGKTSICHVFVNKTFPDTYEPTVFENHTVKIDISGKVILQPGQASVNPPDLCLKWGGIQLCRQPCLES